MARDRAAFDFGRFTGAPGGRGYYRVLVEAGVCYFITSVADAETLRLLAKEVVPEIARP